MEVEEELSFLRQKVTKLEFMITGLNDKIGLILEKFFTRRASQVGSIRQVLQEEEDICLSLATQLKSTLLKSSSSCSSISIAPAPAPVRISTRSVAAAKNGNNQPKSNTNTVSLNPASASTRSAQVILTRLTPATSTRSSTRKEPGKSRTIIQESSSDFEQDQDKDPLDVDNSEEQNVLVELKSEALDLEFEESQQFGTNAGEDVGVGVEDLEMESEQASREEEHEPEKQNRPNRAVAAGPARLKHRSTHLPHYVYTKGRTFPSLEEAKAVIASENRYKYRYNTRLSDCLKYTYFCKHDVTCPIRMNLIVRDGSQEVEENVTPTSQGHVHRTKVRGKLAPDVKQALDEIYYGCTDYRNRTRVLYVQGELRKRGFVVESIPRQKVSNYIQYLRNKQLGNLSFLKRARHRTEEEEVTPTQ